jgi:hypothetical protein
VVTFGTSAAARLGVGLWTLWAAGVLAYYFAYVPRALVSRDVAQRRCSLLPWRRSLSFDLGASGRA